MSDDDDLPTVSPDGAVILYVLAHLVGHLNSKGVLDANEFADLLTFRADTMPEMARPLLDNLIEGIRPASTRIRPVDID